eukprot:gnl/TRDRNA2_/TRDRNA2_61483_c0_seq1.p1 gnl/TRDRNA2_/TRDRNA2_61483_c0~~gnl/TRDRNA2_/TRDRNA2_61483_c0_seq1.p1  ORF type:complete len:305 (-),score=45.19 gnl/TRDRNA2_/TRDRNA2_61483_c0_seq1:277-1191(-)
MHLCSMHQQVSVTMGDCDGAFSEPPAAAILGFGRLGCRIAAELMLLGSEVAVYDLDLAKLGPHKGKESIDKTVMDVLHEEPSLLTEAGMQLPRRDSKSPWKFYANDAGRSVRWANTIADAVKGAAIVIESVPDSREIKRKVFSEAHKAAPTAFLATSTLSIPLAELCELVLRDIENPSGCEPVIGMRFMWPVTFISFVEITLTSKQISDGTQDRVLSFLQQWGKAAFKCDVQGAVSGSTHPADTVGGTNVSAWAAWQLGANRLRLDQMAARKRQVIEARLRKAHHEGAGSVAALTPALVYGEAS